MKKLLFLSALVVAIFQNFISFADARDFTGPDGRVWHHAKTFPKTIYQDFLQKSKGISGPLDVVLRPSRQESARMVTAEIKDEIAVFYYRGVPGGQGYALPEEWLKKYPEYILEIRWQDKSGKWRYWWNKQKLDSPLLARPEFYPLAVNAPF